MLRQRHDIKRLVAGPLVRVFLEVMDRPFEIIQQSSQRDGIVGNRKANPVTLAKALKSA